MNLPKFHSKVFLAPMAGVTDPAFRLLCKKLGAGLVVTELTSIHAITAKKDEIKDFVAFSEKERPLSIQLFGSDLEYLEKAVRIVSPNFEIIDYNMGCPAQHITEQMACSALLQKPELTRKIFRTMVKASSKPISVKMRSGINKPDKFLEIAKIAEEEGISMLTLHPRTVKQGYSGKSDWNLIKELKEAVKIPVVGNGDIETPEDAKRMMDDTGCDYVMIGREASRNPFIFKQTNTFLKTGKYAKISAKTKLKSFFEYLDYSKDYSIKPSIVRMHAMEFSKGVSGSKELRGKLIPMKTIEEIREVMEEFYKKI